MKMLLLLLALVVVVGISVWGLNLYRTIQVSRVLIHTAVPFQMLSEDHSKTLLVLGDSTAVGVGATAPASSLGGLVSNYEQMTYTENDAVSGAVTADLPGQIKKAKLSQYDLILIQIGGNDIIRFHDPKKAGQQLAAALKALPPAKKVIIVAPGDVGGSTLFPPPLSWIYTALNKQYLKSFTAAVAQAGIGEFVDFGETEGTKKIKADPKTYLAADGLHPSSAGYALWFKDMQGALP